MKDKLINIVLIVIAIFAPILCVPKNEFIGSYTLKNILLLTCGFLLLLLILANYKKLNFDIKDFLLLAFIVLIIISGFLSNNFHNFIFGEYTRYEGFPMFLTYALIYIAAKKFFQHERISKFLNIMFYVSIFICILGIIQTYIFTSNIIYAKTATGTFGNPNFFGSYISIILPIAIAFYILYDNSKAFILSSLLFLNMLLSGTRSAWIAFIVVAFIGFIYLLKQKDKKFYHRAVLLTLCFLLLFIFAYNDFGTYIFKPIANSLGDILSSEFSMYKKLLALKDELSLLSSNGLISQIGHGRIGIWSLTFDVIGKYPLFGCGPDNLAFGIAQSNARGFIKYTSSFGGIIDKAHNEYFHIAATIGIPALIIYLSFLALVVLPKMKNINKDDKSLIFTLAILSYLAQAFFNISTIGVAPLFWMLLGLCDSFMTNQNNLLCERSNVDNEQNEKKNI